MADNNTPSTPGSSDRGPGATSQSNNQTGSQASSQSGSQSGHQAGSQSGNQSGTQAGNKGNERPTEAKSDGTSSSLGRSAAALAGGDLGAAKNIGNELFNAVRDRTDSMLTEQKSRAADQIDSVAELVRNVAGTVEDAGQGAIAGYATDAADQIGDFADRIRQASWRELAADAEQVARRWPTLFVASAVTIGFVAGRFMIASRPTSAASAAPTNTRMGQGGSAGGSSSGANQNASRTATSSGTGSREGQAGYGAQSAMEKR